MSTGVSKLATLPVLDDTLCQQLQVFMLKNIPLTRAMQMTLEVHQHTLMIKAPLQPNINDKGTAFGGSISSLMTLAGWCWMWLVNTAHQFSREIVIHQGMSSFLLPVKQELHIVCNGPDQKDWTNYLLVMHRKGRARLSLQSDAMLDKGKVAASLAAKYVTLQPS